MLYIPPDRTISIIPDTGDLPATILLPRDRRAPFVILAIAGIWMMFGGASAFWMPYILPQMDLWTLVAVTFVITLTALVLGIFALRRYASNDEITITAEGIKVRQYHWFRRLDRFLPWSDVSAIETRSVPGGYTVLELVINGFAPVPVFISRASERAEHTRKALEALRAAG